MMEGMDRVGGARSRRSGFLTDETLMPWWVEPRPGAGSFLWAMKNPFRFRPATACELPISRDIAGVNMRLTTGAVREPHWHKEAEWAT